MDLSAVPQPGFLAKNRDTVSLDLIRMLEVSKNQLLHQMFQDSPIANRRNSSRVTLTPKNSVRVRQTYSSTFLWSYMAYICRD